MTHEERAKRLGNPLTRAIDRLCATFSLTPEQHEALSDFSAELIGRATSMAAGTVVPLGRQIEEVARRLDGQSTLLHDIERRINGRADQQDAHGDRLDQKRKELDDHERRIAALEARQVGDASG